MTVAIVFHREYRFIVNDKYTEHISSTQRQVGEYVWLQLEISAGNQIAADFRENCEYDLIKIDSFYMKTAIKAIYE